MIIFKLDELVPCLKDMETGDIYDTEVIRIRRKSVLSHYNKRTGWYINWSKFPESTEVYALVLKGTNDIQGMIAIASELSLKHGYDGFLYAEAMDQELYDYYCSEFQALKLPPIDNPYRFMMSDEVTARIREVYSYEWTDEII